MSDVSFSQGPPETVLDPEPAEVLGALEDALRTGDRDAAPQSVPLDAGPRRSSPGPAGGRQADQKHEAQHRDPCVVSVVAGNGRAPAGGGARGGAQQIEGPAHFRSAPQCVSGRITLERPLTGVKNRPPPGLQAGEVIQIIDVRRPPRRFTWFQRGDAVSRRTRR